MRMPYAQNVLSPLSEDRLKYRSSGIDVEERMLFLLKRIHAKRLERSSSYPERTG